MSTARVFARNLSANWFSFGANLVVMFFLSPFIVHTLGATVYGIWSVLMVVTGYMGLFDVGVRVSTGRYITLFLGRDDHRRLGETVRTSLTFFSVLGLVFLAAGVIIGLGFPYFFRSVPEQYHGLLILLVPLLAVNLWLAVISQVFSCILTAHDRFDLARAVDLCVLVVRTVGMVIALKAGYGIVGMTVVTMTCGFLTLAANYSLANRVYPSLRVRPLGFVKSRLRELFGYGIWAAISSSAFRIIGQTDLIVVGALISTSEVTVYSVGAMLVMYSDAMLSKIYTTFFPPLQRAAARGDMNSVREYYLRQVRLGLTLGIPMCLGFAIFGQQFISLWMGDPTEFPPSSVAGSAVVLLILSIVKLIYLPAFGGEQLLAIVDRVRFASITAVVEACANLGLSIFFVLVMDWGIAGVAAGTLVSRVLVRFWIIPWQAWREAGLPAHTFLQLIALGVTASVGFGLWSSLVRLIINEGSWPLFWAQVAVVLLGYAPMGFFLLVPRSDRQRIVRRIRLIMNNGACEAAAEEPAR